MKVLLVNGSPKAQGSASAIILDALRERIGETARIVSCHAAKQDSREFIQAARGCNALVFAFPLYADGIPAHLLRLLDEVQHIVAQAAPCTRVYVVVNNGFYEGRQNILALEMMRNFCDCAGLAWGKGLGVGGGGMTGAVPVGHGPLKRLGLAIDALATAIQKGETAADDLLEPGFPRFLYHAAAHRGWRLQAKRNGLKPRQLMNRR
jgi:multimeric flavodoxin WrbA